MALVDTIKLEEVLQSAQKAKQDPPINERYYQQSREGPLEEPFLHSQGCPKYKVLVKLMRQSRSPTRSQGVLHPKPWGARDPKQIPCTCGPIISKTRSPPGSVRASPVRASPVREVRRVVRRETASPERVPSPPRTALAPGKTEVLKLFEEFCGRSEVIGAKLSDATLDGMCTKIRSKLGTRGSTVSPPRSLVTRPNKADEKMSAETVKRGSNAEPPSPQREPSTLRSPAPSTVRGKVEASNVMVEISELDFPEPGAAFPNILGAVMPNESITHYVALRRGNQFFGPPDMIGPPISMLSMSDSTDAYIPMSEVLSPVARRMHSPTRLPRRRP